MEFAKAGINTSIEHELANLPVRTPAATSSKLVVGSLPDSTIQ
jgi:hypothetical protein